MRSREPKPVPPRHPIRAFFRTLTTRGLSQTRMSEADLVLYVSDMLVRFVHVDGLYRLRDERGVRMHYLADMLSQAEDAAPSRKPDALRHVGDYALFVLGFYPESLIGQRKLVGPDYYAEQGRRCYSRAAEMYGGTPVSPLLRKLATHFEELAVGLHWVREYTHDPFYQYMLHQFTDERECVD